jgi:hypothetical protein
MQLAGTHVPVAPAFTPVTVNVTVWPTSGEPPLVTCAVTVCALRMMFVASSGVREILSEATTIDVPAIRMYA